jgi:carbamoyl-phosphate synthase small subunit
MSPAPKEQGSPSLEYTAVTSDDAYQTRASLVLEDGMTFNDGYSFGHAGSIAGEVVFNTGMVGYPEALTDPSYTGQILVLTYPLVGNYGVPSDEKDHLGLPKSFEGLRIHARAVIVADYSFEASHYTACKTLADWLKEQKVPGVFGLDTRAITKYIRTKGAVLGKVIVDGSVKEADLPLDDPNLLNLVAEVSCTEKRVFEPAGVTASTVPHILAIDCGMKLNIIRFFVEILKVKLTVVPWDFDFRGEKFDGLFISNGPGDPEMCRKTIDHVKDIMQRRPMLPIFGICLGNQILALAAGATTYKMKFGNRGMNQPCIDLRTSRCYVTPQNHGFAVDADSLPNDWMPMFVNANDGSNEGIIHRSRPWFSVQFHPEACGGPTDMSFLFDSFLSSVNSPGSNVITTIPYQVPKTYFKVLVLGSGGLSIGQAGEFDYSGSQAIKALKESGIQSIVINPNIATIQTSPGLADKIYFTPVTPEFVTQVIEKERPDGILCTFGGQTALNCACQLEKLGVFQKYGCRVLGTQIKSIILTEDRELFARAVEEVGEKVAESEACTEMEEAVKAAAKIGYPVLVRAAFALGGLGSGFASNEEELRELVNVALTNSPQVMIDKSLKGWKELEYEVVRDCNDNCITVCNMENLDPMGIHTGDSIVIAPSQTLNNEEYYQLRKCALKVIRHIGVVGECNIQYAVDPFSKEYRIIEVNARLSRSSALASKATGYPLAYVAAKLALGHTLVDLRNQVTKCTTACFEPSLDYCVAKIPRWDLRKFATVDQEVGSCMKSVGEVMAIGRTFEETIQKALRMVDEQCDGFDGKRYDIEFACRGKRDPTVDDVKGELERPSPVRIWAVARALEMGLSVDDIHELSRIDRWFLAKLRNIHLMKQKLKTMDYFSLEQQPETLKAAKRCGFADTQIAISLSKAKEAAVPSLPHLTTDEQKKEYQGGVVQEMHIQALRRKLKIMPVVKQIDTLAAEFPAETNYLYLTYNGSENDVESLGNGASRLLQSASGPPVVKRVRSFEALENTPSPNRSSGYRNSITARANAIATCESPSGNEGPVIVLGCGPYRIGSSVEFDWCSVSCIRALRAMGRSALVINCNPETVSTDFDESDRLYFEELRHEVVSDICEFECPQGVVISVGGQTPNNLAMGLAESGIPIVGTSVDAIDACENRFKFSKLCDSLRIDQPSWSQFTAVDEAFHFCKTAGYPVLVRPSYVLSGAAMRVVHADSELESFLQKAAVVSRDYPVVISKYIIGAKEVEMDGVAQDGDLLNYAIAEHVENAGTHSGDASLILPAQKLFVETHRRVKKITQKICRALRISGPFNIQFMCKENEVKVIECNLRASRSFPFISKTLNINFIEMATKVMLGMPVRPMEVQMLDMDFVAVKCPVFSFSRLKNSDPRLGVEMQSTGEVACFGRNHHEAFLKAMLSTGFKLPDKNILLSIGDAERKLEFLPIVELLQEMGFSIYATKNTHDALVNRGVQGITFVYKPHVKREPNAATLIRMGKIDLVINVPDSMDSAGMTDGFAMRRMAIDSGIGLITDIKTATLLGQALHRKWSRERTGRPFWGIESWQEYQCLAA